MSMLASFILGIVSILQKIQFNDLYTLLGAYLLLVWVGYGVWVWKDTEKRYESNVMRFLAWFLTTFTFIFGLFLYLLMRPALREDDDRNWLELEHKYLVYETYGMEKCKTCGFQLRPEFMCCPACGEVLRETCESCNHVVDMHWNICPYCGDVRIPPMKENLLEGKQGGFQQLLKRSMEEFAKAYQYLYDNTKKLFVDTQMQKKKPAKSGAKRTKTSKTKQPLSSVKQLIFVEEKTKGK